LCPTRISTRVDPFSSGVQILEDAARVVERTSIAAVETEDREDAAEQTSGIGDCRHRPR
jgi:hypothetical protein